MPTFKPPCCTLNSLHRTSVSNTHVPWPGSSGPFHLCRYTHETISLTASHASPDEVLPAGFRIGNHFLGPFLGQILSCNGAPFPDLSRQSVQIGRAHV